MSMSEDGRPNPDDLLEVIKREENESRKGKLKIFLGMAAGVGKTYAMLEAAQNLVRVGGDVVVGIVETHGRPETEKLLEGLKIIPQKWINYKDSVFEELDIDEIIRMNPSLVLVDELPHSNVPGARHPKRWQDIVEILDNGIDVYTTLNVQHIESLKDVMENITGVVIRETVPDKIVEKANYIELVDITPHELLQRLKEGKVYLGAQSVIAARHFFQEDRLMALREMVLRYAAEKIDHDLQGMVGGIQRPNGWKPRERLLVAISQSPHSQKLIRITRRLAFTLDAPWIALHVDDGTVLEESDHGMLDKNIALARDLGAEVITTSDSDVVQAIQRVARQKSISQIIIGHPPKRKLLGWFERSSLVDRLMRECSNVDVHVIRQAMAMPYRKKWKLFSFPDQISSYSQVIACVAFLTAFNWYFFAFVGYKVVGLIYLLGVLVLSLFFRKGPVYFGAILSASVWNFAFIPRTASSWEMSDEDTAFLAFFLLTAMVTGILTDRGRKNKEMLIKREKSIRVLYEIVRKIAASPSLTNMLQSVIEHLSSVLNGSCEIILKDFDGGLVFDERQKLLEGEKEHTAATWVFQNSKEAGWSTSTLPSVRNLYIPLKGIQETVGVLAYHPKVSRPLSVEEKNFLYTVSEQLANRLERSLLEQGVRKKENYRNTERIYQSILNLVSNLFQPLLSNIQDAVKEIMQKEEGREYSTRLSHLEQISNASESLARIVENVKAMAQLSSGLTPVNKKTNNLEALVLDCIENVKKTISSHQFAVRIQRNMPLIPFDFELIELLLYNLIFNALEYSPINSTIEIEAHIYGDHALLSIADDGAGIPEEMIQTVFEKFYRIPGTNSTGLGLGLAIAKTIAEIHGGSLKAANREIGGTILTLNLPI